MEFVFLDNKKGINELASGEKYSQFLQSWEWGDFQESLGYKIFRVGLKDKNQILAIATLIKKPILTGASYFYCPRGPVVRNKKEIIKILFSYIKKLAQKERAIFLRFESSQKIKDKLIVKTLDVQPSKTLVLDLEKSKEELLREMHPKTRYNIRLSFRRGVKVFSGNEKDFEDFWKLMTQTGRRDQFRLHPREHYQKLFDLSKNNNQSLSTEFLLACHEREVLAAGIFAFFGNLAVYLHGASSNLKRNLMAPYALQWQAIKMAREQGKKYYDFYGIDELKWPGVTRFKKGFGGQVVQHPGTFDYIFNKVYYKIYLLARKTRRIF